jgi:hypothetical protein
MMSSEIPPSTNTNIDSGWLEETTVRAYFLVTLHGDLGVLPSKPLRVVIRTGKTAEVVRALSITCVE